MPCGSPKSFCEEPNNLCGAIHADLRGNEGGDQLAHRTIEKVAHVSFRIGTIFRSPRLDSQASAILG